MVLRRRELGILAGALCRRRSAPRSPASWGRNAPASGTASAAARAAPGAHRPAARGPVIRPGGRAGTAWIPHRPPREPWSHRRPCSAALH